MDPEAVQEQLGATMPVGGESVTLFIPEKDRDGALIDQDRWVDEALAVFGKLFRGATAFPPGKGVWRDDERGGQLLFEQTVMILAFVSPEVLYDDHNLAELNQFLHYMGREARQGEVGVVIGGNYYGITDSSSSAVESSSEHQSGSDQ